MAPTKPIGLDPADGKLKEFLLPPSSGSETFAFFCGS